MQITFTYTGYTKQGRKFNKGTHEVTEADYVHFKPYSTDAVSDIPESTQDAPCEDTSDVLTTEETRRRGRKPKETE